MGQSWDLQSAETLLRTLSSVKLCNKFNFKSWFLNDERRRMYFFCKCKDHVIIGLYYARAQSTYVTNKYCT